MDGPLQSTFDTATHRRRPTDQRYEEKYLPATGTSSPFYPMLDTTEAPEFLFNEIKSRRMDLTDERPVPTTVTPKIKPSEQPDLWDNVGPMSPKSLYSFTESHTTSSVTGTNFGHSRDSSWSKETWASDMSIHAANPLQQCKDDAGDDYSSESMQLVDSDLSEYRQNVSSSCQDGRGGLHWDDYRLTELSKASIHCLQRSVRLTAHILSRSSAIPVQQPEEGADRLQETQPGG
jgi:hypothetical protein